MTIVTGNEEFSAVVLHRRGICISNYGAAVQTPLERTPLGGRLDILVQPE